MDGLPILLRCQEVRRRRVGSDGAPNADPDDIMPTAKALFCLK